MITREQIPSVLDHAVYDTQGNKIGDAKHIFLDDVSGRPEWASVRTGMFGARESFVPIRDASLIEDHLEVPFDKAMVKDAPNVQVDAGGHLSAEEEHRLYEYYGVDWDTTWQQPGQRDAGMAGGEAGMAAAGGTPRSAAAGTEEGQETAEEPYTGRVPAEAASERAGEPVQERAASMPAAEQAPQTRAGEWENALTRSEEQMHISTERTESGHARLRKYVVTEQTEQTVPLMHEEVRVERQPISEQERGGMSSEITEGDQREVTLHAERPVIETETVAVERIRLNVEERTDQETVRGQVRKEKVDVELPEEAEPGSPEGRGGAGGGGR
ncbi:PRC and DUF2382 domain-containing protein [Streptomyces odontomachi]|uniref:PRC and DUF2382 domain-containing protein n=1 Tax=Streptomyces odontomachi TaxID=2944940 RepID=UPI002109DA69|nr:PRC and DUF2382 domain-containing protein [Streptomyces sp. ODS25]